MTEATRSNKNLLFQQDKFVTNINRRRWTWLNSQLLSSKTFQRGINRGFNYAFNYFKQLGYNFTMRCLACYDAFQRALNAIQHDSLVRISPVPFLIRETNQLGHRHKLNRRACKKTNKVLKVTEWAILSSVGQPRFALYFLKFCPLFAALYFKICPLFALYRYAFESEDLTKKVKFVY